MTAQAGTTYFKWLFLFLPFLGLGQTDSTAVSVYDSTTMTYQKETFGFDAQGRLISHYIQYVDSANFANDLFLNAINLDDATFNLSDQLEQKTNALDFFKAEFLSKTGITYETELTNRKQTDLQGTIWALTVGNESYEATISGADLGENLGPKSMIISFPASKKIRLTVDNPQQSYTTQTVDLSLKSDGSYQGVDGADKVILIRIQ